MNNTFRVLVVTGPRQVGKSTLLDSLKPNNMTKVTLDDETLRNRAKEDPRQFIETYPTPLFIDEAQYAPELFSYIKMKVDNDKTRGQYWLSGSQAFELMKGVTESLAGRAGILKMNSFTYNEIVKNENPKLFDPENLEKRDFIDVNKTFELIFNGGMPELYDVPNMERMDFYNSYVNTYIERDVKKIKDIGNIESFRKFMRAVAVRTGTTLNYSNIANEVGSSDKTIRAWMSVLVSTGLACYLANWESARALQLSDNSGRFFESYIISEIIKGYENKGIKLDITHLRNKETNEIDLIIRKNNTLYPLEIKKTSMPRKEMIKNFKFLENTHEKVGTGGIICTYDTLMKIDDKNYIIPIASVINV